MFDTIPEDDFFRFIREYLQETRYAHLLHYDPLHNTSISDDILPYDK